ncbi:S-methyl-5-thioribose-1-phosphate isomerase [bacterium]|nr:S-methyl-5-thioribose-1-phosphate isomerase [bacterium]MDB4640658.1 S-methyl-5-thioribose-1-phosphate isomerase [Pirellulaceae bacterium]
MNTTKTETLRWIGEVDGHLELIDQTLLPTEFTEIACKDVQTVWDAIKQLKVRGAPAIGIAAGYGMVVGLQTVSDSASKEEFFSRLKEVSDYLAGSRPTAVNLFWAIERIARTAESNRDKSIAELKSILLTDAIAIHDEDREMCHAIGRFGAELLKDGQGVLTHCNAGGLATAEYGTALSVFFTAQDVGKNLHIFVDETRPLLQGSRLTAWELQHRQIESTLICDNMAAQVMREGKVQAVVTGADRIARNGDSANKIGTYGVACLAKAHNIPFYIAAPTTTFDLTIESGDEIPIEERASEEITNGFNKQTAPDGVNVYNPAFDVTPAELIKAIITEKGIIQPVTVEEIQRVIGYV